MSAVAFYYLATVTIVTGVFAITLRSPVHCGLALVAMLIHMAGFFVLLNAEFIAAVQVIVYAGAILVLYLFVIMLLNLKSDERVFHKRYIGVGLIATQSSPRWRCRFRPPYAGMTGDATGGRTGVGRPRRSGSSCSATTCCRSS
jgi:NADH-quinone oxidoreductase subunit J